MSRDRLNRLHRALISALMSLLVVRSESRAGRSERGAALVEYTLIVGLVALVCVGGLLLIGGFVSGDLTNTAKGFGP